MGPLGLQEMTLIVVLALVLFGPKKLPELGRLLGRGLREFNRAKSELKSTFESHMRELEREANLEKETLSIGSTSSYTPDYSSPRYPYQYDEYGQEPNTVAAVEHPQLAAPQSEPQSAETPTATPVNGTVARSNGVHPVEHSTEEEHRPV